MKDQAQAYRNTIIIISKTPATLINQLNYQQFTFLFMNNQALIIIKQSLTLVDSNNTYSYSTCLTNHTIFIINNYQLSTYPYPQFSIMSNIHCQRPINH